MSRQVLFAPEADTDLAELEAFIAERSGSGTALAYGERIVAFCVALSDFPERGTLRDDLRPGLRIIGFEGRAAIAFHVSPDTVVIDRVLYGGRDLGTAFTDEN